MKALGKVGLKKLSKEALKKSIDDVAKKLLKTCVFACFPAGTLIQTEHGTKPIEDIQIGDLVWAYDEDTNTTALQPVVDIMQNESDHTISLYTETEVIETTALHPFYTQDGWKDASELQAGDKIKTQNSQEITIETTQFNYEPKKVYNFTVGNFHTYFVGQQKALVHNTGKCISKLAENFAKTWDDLAKLKHCFAEGTLVKIENGVVPIESLKIGDLVASYNFDKKEVVYSAVKEVYHNEADSFLKIYVEDDVVECTQNHQFWSASYEDWITAKDINEGDLLLSANGKKIKVGRIESLKQTGATFNLEIENLHNYFVSSLDILVHNGNPFPTSIYNDLTTRSTEIYRYFDPVTNETQYIGKTVQGIEKRAGQHATEKGLQKLVDEGKLAYEGIAKGDWNKFQTAAHEQHFISKFKTKGRKGSAAIWNKINALSAKKFDYFSKLIGCGKIN
jgi:hypothetical protein